MPKLEAVMCCPWPDDLLQMSAAKTAWTMTTPLGKPLKKKNMMEIMGAHQIPYAASACSCFPDDLRSKIRKAKKIRGTKYIHILSPCPTGWRFSERLTPNVGRLAVETNYYPLYEIRNGKNYKITYESKGLPVGEYLMIQNRFKHLKDKELELIQQDVDRKY